MALWNPFRIAGDCLHLLSKCILIFAIHRNRSAEGVSWITQILYAVVFCSRYLNIFHESHIWNLVFKILYITSSFYIIAIMRWVFPRSRERELSWKLGTAILGGSLLLSPFGMLIFVEKENWSLLWWLWSFSLILEAVAVLPQLLLLRQTTVPTVIDSYYLLALGSYRGFYILNWIWRAADAVDKHDIPPNGLSVLCGVIQTLLYVDFAWVYWTRQRVKLRSGGVVDADDIRQGWLLRRVFGLFGKRLNRGAAYAGLDHGGDDEDEDGDEESAPAFGGSAAAGSSRGGRPSANRWGARGISVSADDTTLEHERLFEAERSDGHHNLDASVDPDAKMQDPEDLARALEDDADEDDDDGTPPPPPGKDHHESGVRNNEWAD